MKIYKNKLEKRVPGVTTVIGGNLGWNKRALMYWAWDEGILGNDFRDTSKKAADAGTIAHSMIEHDLRGIDFAIEYDLALKDKVENCYLAWLEWKRNYEFQLIEAELPLVSEKHQFGGTLDLTMIKNVDAILDLKTSNAVYPEMLIQVAAYGHLYNENFPEKQIQSYHILRLGKEDASFHHHHWYELESAWECFLSLLNLHRLKKTFKGKI
ncbi:MAG: hypothetical protein SVO01_00340 [Thermotogota bacterium]|nr:hypothetical protein [Thermotogota bacterium]